MSPVEKLQAAIDKLEALKADRAYVEYNGWLAEPNTGDTYRGPLEPREDLVPVTNDELMVVLHRTIDAQLAILHRAIEVERVWHGEFGHANVAPVALAESILGAGS